MKGTLNETLTHSCRIASRACYPLHHQRRLSLLSKCCIVKLSSLLSKSLIILPPFAFPIQVSLVKGQNSDYPDDSFGSPSLKNIIFSRFLSCFSISTGLAQGHLKASHYLRLHFAFLLLRVWYEVISGTPPERVS